MAQPSGDELQRAYEAGRDAAINGPNTTNCHFRFFSSPESTAAWERGKASTQLPSCGKDAQATD